MNDNAAIAFREYLLRFVTLTDADWALLSKHLVEKTLKKNDFFAQEGKKANEVAFVLEGNLRQYYIHDGEEKTTYFYFENHLMSSYISCMTEKVSELTIEALTNCRILTFSYTTLKELFNKSHVWERFGRLVAEYLAIGLEERMTGLLMLSPEERYLQLIASSKNKIIERIPQHYIANYLGITPVSLSRIRNRSLKK